MINFLSSFFVLFIICLRNFELSGLSLEETLVSAARHPATRDMRSLYILLGGFIGPGKATRWRQLMGEEHIGGEMTHILFQYFTGTLQSPLLWT